MILSRLSQSRSSETELSIWEPSRPSSRSADLIKSSLALFVQPEQSFLLTLVPLNRRQPSSAETFHCADGLKACLFSALASESHAVSAYSHQKIPSLISLEAPLVLWWQPWVLLLVLCAIVVLLFCHPLDSWQLACATEIRPLRSHILCSVSWRPILSSGHCCQPGLPTHP